MGYKTTRRGRVGLSGVSNWLGESTCVREICGAWHRSTCRVSAQPLTSFLLGYKIAFMWMIVQCNLDTNNFTVFQCKIIQNNLDKSNSR